MSILVLIILFAIAQGVFLGIIMLTINRGNRRANRVWGVLMILTGYSILPVVMVSADLIQYYPHLYLTGHPVLFLFGPFFMLYTIYLTDITFKLKLIHCLHLMPFVLYMIILSPILALSSEDKIAMINSTDSSGMSAEIIVSVLIIAHVYIYLFFINRIINRYDKKIKNSFSSLDKINLIWLRRSVYSMAIIFGAMMSIIILAMNIGVPIWNSDYHLIIPFLVAFVLYYDTYKTIRQPELYIGVEDSENAKRYEGSSLTEVKALDYRDKLLEFMKTEKPYKESNLTIKNLAIKVKIPSYYISQIINDKLNQNFFDFINRYRIEETKEMFKDPRYENYSILAIAYEAGFNSKSVFNSSFKKYTGMTPSQYRQHTTGDDDEIKHAS